MGYYSINVGSIYRDHVARLIHVSVYCDELNRTMAESFAFEDIDKALEWLKTKLNEKSM